jgi:APA family basic amino acid/polyamine antiporter
VTGATAFVVTNMIGSGIFTVPAFVRTATGSAPMSLAVWGAGALLALCGALCYAELATRMPSAGGEYRYLERSYGPLFGFLSGWTSFFVGFSAAVAASALGVVAYAAHLVPGWDPAAPVAAGGAVTQGAAAAAALVIVLAAVHCVGVRQSGAVQSALAGLVLVAIAGLVVVGLASGNGSLRGLTASTAGTSSWWVALVQVTYAYAGWNAAAYLGGEIRRPRRNLPRALLGGTVAVALAYLSLNALFFYAMPEAVWQANIAVGQEAARRLFGDVGGLIVAAVITVAILGSVSAMTAAGPRIYFAMARDGVAPRILGRVGERSQVPTIAIVAQAAVAMFLALTGAFEALLVYIGSALLVFNGLTIATVFRYRDRRRGSDDVFRIPMFPLPPVIFLVVTVWALGNAMIDRPVPTGAAMVTILLGGVAFEAGRRLGWMRR